jgi:hypothetical protein
MRPWLHALAHVVPSGEKSFDLLMSPEPREGELYSTERLTGNSAAGFTPWALFPSA